jgi:pyruvate dehydrogenase E2 component (dihydrolipoamide acetyltransferase)
MSDAVQVSPPTGLKGDVVTTELERHERSVARRSAEIRATVPDVEFTAVIEMSAAEERAAAGGVSINALIVEATAAALRAVPRLNGAYRDGHYEQYSRVNIGVTIFGEGLYAIPTIFDADERTASELSAELSDYADRARSDALAPGELTGATFTLTAPAGEAVSSATPLIIAPQAGALAAGAVRDEPVVRDGALVAGRTMVITLACDHRISHGHHAAAFLAALKANLERAA